MARSRLHILAHVDHYLPGVKFGGPIRSIANVVEGISDSVEFSIFTQNRDFGERTAYREVEPNRWSPVGGASVFYATPENYNVRYMMRAVRERRADVLYLNSFFSRIVMRVMFARRLRLFPSVPIILAPRGELMRGALDLKRRRKTIYVSMARQLALFDSIVWQASSPEERHSIEAMWPGAVVHLAAEAPAAGAADAFTLRRPGIKRAGSARFIFLNRISRTKNLPYALRLLSSIQGRVDLDIFGPIEDESHWQLCKKLIADLPSTATVRYRGVAHPAEIAALLSGYDYSILPTLGENFCHSIFECLSAGLPVITSDLTPWRELTRSGVGWDLPLADPGRWLAALQQCVDMGPPEHDGMSRRANQFATGWLQRHDTRAMHVALFERAAARTGWDEGRSSSRE